MTDTPAIDCVVFGAGALGLGFLGPELSPHCRITCVDIAAKADLLEGLQRERGYALNLTGLTLRTVRVDRVGGIVAGSDEVGPALDGSDLVFTAVGAANLPALAAVLARVARRRESGRPLRVLCSENGVEVARTLRQAVREEANEELAGRLLVGDTVMGRMCKVVQQPRPPLAAPVEGLDWAVVAEPFYGIPVEAHAVAGMAELPPAVEPQEADRFRASEDAKMLAHNGLHAVLACAGHLRGAERFDELRADAELMELGRRLLAEEAAPALLAKHGPALPRNQCLNYCDSILRRVTCPVLRDPIARGTRGIMRKLEPWERLVHGVRTVAGQGIEPVAFAAGLAMAVTIARREGETEMSFDEVLTRHCAFDPEDDAHLIELIQDQRHLIDAGE